MAMGGLGLCQLSQLGQPVVTAPDKMMRELFIGNTPQDTANPQLLQDFLNAAMKKANLALNPPLWVNNFNPVIQCRLSSKFAFVQLRTELETRAMLDMSGIPFMGQFLKITRPSKFPGKDVGVRNWQQLTGVAPTGMPPAGVLATTTSSSSSNDNHLDPEHKIHREIFVGNTDPNWSADALQAFLNTTLNQVNLFSSGRDPVVKSRVCGKFSFIEMRNPMDATLGLCLNGIPYMNMELKLGRPQKYPGDHDLVKFKWADVLNMVMRGEVVEKGGVPKSIKDVLMSGTGNGAAAAAVAGSGSAPLADAASASNAAAAAPAEAKSCVLALTNMVSPPDFESDDAYAELTSCIRSECATFGNLVSLTIPRPGERGYGNVYLQYSDMEGSGSARGKLEGRTFDGNVVGVRYVDEAEYGRGEMN
jgi:hypothetical protein